MNERVARRNIRLLQFFAGLRSAIVVMPVIVPFFQSNGLNQTQIFTLQAVYSVVVVILEVPSGYFADRFGRRLSLVIGAVSSVCGFISYSLAYGLWPLLATQVILAIGASAISGADSALAFDTLREHPSITTYSRFAARNIRYTFIGTIVASLGSGLIAMHSIRMAVAAQVLIYLPLLPMALALREPARTIRPAKNAFKDAWEITKYALHGHKEIKWLIISGALVSTMTYPMVWLSQPYFQMLGIPISLFGFLWALQYLFSAAFTSMVAPFEALGRRTVLIAFVGFGVVTYLVLGLWPSYISLLTLLMLYFTRAVAGPILGDYVYQLVESDMRATVGSVQNLVARLFAAVVGLVLGAVTDTVSLPAALLVAAGFFGVCGAAVLVAMYRARLL